MTSRFRVSPSVAWLERMATSFTPRMAANAGKFRREEAGTFRSADCLDVTRGFAGAVNGILYMTTDGTTWVASEKLNCCRRIVRALVAANSVGVLRFETEGR
jgi:hypothetical protein